MNYRATVVKALTAKILQLAELKGAYTPDRYTREVYQAAAQYWKDGNKGGFTTRMNGTIKFGLQSAWEEGAASVDVAKEDFSPEDKDEIAEIIDTEKSYVSGLLDFMDGIANDPKAKLTDADYRLDMWANRYQDVVSQAMIYFGGKIRLAWVLGEAEHCETCLALSRIVAWAKEWDESGIKPKDQRLACHGFNCACEMEETSRRRSPKAFDRIMAIIG
ncbi:MAG: hypothetical protein WC710_14040 [Gallionella sp.]